MKWVRRFFPGRIELRVWTEDELREMGKALRPIERHQVDESYGLWCQAEAQVLGRCPLTCCPMHTAEAENCRWAFV